MTLRFRDRWVTSSLVTLRGTIEFEPLLTKLRVHVRDSQHVRHYVRAYHSF
jgi:hypothetical protein